MKIRHWMLTAAVIPASIAANLSPSLCQADGPSQFGQTIPASNSTGPAPPTTAGTHQHAPQTAPHFSPGQPHPPQPPLAPAAMAGHGHTVTTPHPADARPSKFLPAPPEPTAFEQQLHKLLAQTTDNELPSQDIQALAEKLQTELHVPVIVLQTPEFDGVRYTEATASVPAGMPLGIALKTALRPLYLRAIVRDDAIQIVPDTLALARAGFGTAQYVSIDDNYMRSVAKEMEKRVSIEHIQSPLSDVLQSLNQQTDLHFTIDVRALENLGLTTDIPVTMALENVTLREALRALLAPRDLTLNPRDGHLEVTTMEQAEDPDDAIIRIYWLDGTGLANSDDAMQLIETTVHPDTWESVGGPSTMASIYNSHSQRFGLAIATPYRTHLLIERFLDTVRKNTADPRRQLLELGTMEKLRIPMHGPSGSHMGSVDGGGIF